MRTRVAQTRRGRAQDSNTAVEAIHFVEREIEGGGIGGRAHAGGACRFGIGVAKEGEREVDLFRGGRASATVGQRAGHCEDALAHRVVGGQREEQAVAIHVRQLSPENKPGASRRPAKEPASRTLTR
jgi:hypothetical protein